MKCEMKGKDLAAKVSLPLWECGLKSSLRPGKTWTQRVTPLVGVWIEIYRIPKEDFLEWSLPLWECGLKLVDERALGVEPRSLPLWECGLKLVTRRKVNVFPMSLPLWECGLKSVEV